MSNTKERQIIDTIIADFQRTPEYARLSPTVKQVIDASIEAGAVQNATNILKNVEGTSNLEIIQAPSTIVGSDNPLDVTTKNLDSGKIFGQLSPTIDNAVVPALTKNLASSLTTNILQTISPSLRSDPSLSVFTNALDSITKNAVSSTTKTVLQNFTDGLFSKPPNIPSSISDVDGLLLDSSPEGLQRINQNFDRGVVNKASQEAQNFNIKNDDNNKKLITQSTGFVDPAANYPTQEYSNEVETNKLARNEVRGTIVQKKNLDRLTSIQLPNNEYWEQPISPFKGQYPFNKVFQTESGHVIEMDDTPGGERLQVYHKSGTFIEIDAVGNIVKRTKGSSYEIVDKNGHVSVSGDAAVSVKGKIKVYVGGSAEIEVEGDTNIKCFNDVTVQASGRIDMSATEEINLRSANINIEADVNLSMKGDSNAFLSTTDMYFKANNSIYHEALNDYNTLVSSNYYTQVGSTVNIKSGSSTNIQSSQTNLLSTQNINVDGSQVWINSQKASGAFGASSSLYARTANIGIIGDRKIVEYVPIPNPVATNFLDELGYKAEDTENIDESNAAIHEIKAKGVASQESIDESVVEIEKDTPLSANNNIVKPSDFVLSQTYLPDNYQLSKHFTLAELSSKAVVTKQPVRAQLNLSYGQIVYNLQGIALNILEPLVSLYPNAIVTSAFRLAKNSSTLSDHPRGKAVDIQIPGLSKTQYYEVAKRLASQLNYDKLLLEYKTYGTGLPWIHISFDVNKNRKIVLTYLNDKKYGQGLINLA